MALRDRCLLADFLMAHAAGLAHIFRTQLFFTDVEIDAADIAAAAFMILSAPVKRRVMIDGAADDIITTARLSLFSLRTFGRSMPHGQKE